MYLALRPPWGGAATPAPVTEPVVAMPTSDAGAGSAKPTKKHVVKKHPTGGTIAAGGSEEYEETEPEPPPLTEADRRLEWRGDDVTLPATRIDMGAGGEARGLDDNEINTTVNGQSGGVHDCVVNAATGTDLRATITAKFIVDGSGKVTKSKLHAPHYMFEKGLLGCAQKALRSMKFPATGAPTLVSLPIALG
jgi:hypothetical protein